MTSLDILLIIVCGAGLIHGLTLASYLWIIKNNRTKTDSYLALLVFLMAIRVGKSILLQFTSDLEFLFILLGLSTLLLIGPLFRWYLKSLILPNFKVSARAYVQIVPFLFVFAISPFLSEQWFVVNGRYWAYILLLGIYLHLATYIVISAKDLYMFKRALRHSQKTKSQEGILKWLNFVLIGLTFIWLSYVLNIFEDQVPYILGPLIYTVVIYTLTLVAYRIKIHKLSSKAFEDSMTNAHIYQEILTVLETDDLYLSSDISLNRLGKLTGYGKHIISASINDGAQMNFNSLINYYRVQKAKELLRSASASKYTISSIAFDTGFNSLSSFNAAFKKFVKTTPSRFRSAEGY